MTIELEHDLALFQELILCGHDLYLWRYDEKWNLLDSNCPDADQFDNLLKIKLPKLPADRSVPLVISNRLGLVWICVFSQQGDGIYVVGPAFTEDVTSQSMESALTQADIPMSLKWAFMELLRKIPVIAVNRYFEYGLMLHYCVNKEHLTISDLQYVSEKGEPITAQPYQKAAHASWAMEQELMRLIEEGNMDYKKLAGRIASGGNLGNLGNGDSLRHYKNLTIVFTALCTRAAIRGGVAPEIAYSLSDMYIQAIEAGKDLATISEVNSAMQEDFVCRVHQQKSAQEQSPQIQKCCHYIQSHIKEKITVPALAAQIGYSETYLSKKFKKELGISITEYIAREKIHYAKNLLHSDDTPISDIAQEMGFGSPSYFCEQFKRITGISPGEYRAGSTD